jgi:hypothetical protein
MSGLAGQAEGAMDTQVGRQVIVLVISSLVYGQAGMTRCEALSANDSLSERI